MLAAVDGSARALGDVLAELDDAADESTIFIEVGEIVEGSTKAMVLAEGQPAPHGFRYFLEVLVAREVLEVWSEWRGGRKPSREDRVGAVAYYAARDAFMPTGL
jgi:hypothetical protein